MTGSERDNSRDFFEDHDFDPLTAATGGDKPKPAVAKRKAGFYLSEELLDRFNRRFHQMKLDGVAIVNKSALVEIALTYALDDLEKGEQSVLRAGLQNSTDLT